MPHLSILVSGHQSHHGKKTIIPHLHISFSFLSYDPNFFSISSEWAYFILSFYLYSGCSVFILQSQTPTTGRKLGASMHSRVTYLPGYQVLVSQRHNSLWEKIMLCRLWPFITSVSYVSFWKAASLRHTLQVIFIGHTWLLRKTDFKSTLFRMEDIVSPG